VVGERLTLHPIPGPGIVQSWMRCCDEIEPGVVDMVIAEHAMDDSAPEITAQKGGLRRGGKRVGGRLRQ
jgi:hypothetical protein